MCPITGPAHHELPLPWSTASIRSHTIYRVTPFTCCECLEGSHNKVDIQSRSKLAQERTYINILNAVVSTLSFLFSFNYLNIIL